MDGTTHPLTYGVGAWSVVIAVVAWTAVQSHGRSKGQAQRAA
jgi:hypothetical protein